MTQEATTTAEAVTPKATPKKVEAAKSVKKEPAKKAAPKKEAVKTEGKVRKTTDVNVVRKYIKDMVIYKFGTLTAYAEKAGVSLQYISNVMAGNKPIPPWMYKHFKIAHVVEERWEVVA